MLSKVIGIISYFPDDKELRKNRTMRCFNLLKTLNKHFKLPIIIVAQNWSESDLNRLKQFKNQKIFVYTFDKLGITGARMKLREIFLTQTDADYVILLDDDSELEIGDGAVEHYLKEIDDHPDMLGLWNLSMARLMAVSRKSYEKLSFDFIKDLDAERLECWEDHCWRVTFQRLWPQEMYNFSHYNMNEVSLFSEKDPNSVYYHKWVNDPQEVKNQRNAEMVQKCLKIIGEWEQYMRNNGAVISCSFIIPVYNSSEYIIRCLDSIPTRKDIEVIVVDDCSTDNTLELLNNYNSRWGKYTVLHQEENRGPGEARQRGLDVAVGDRVYFGDSDDWFITENINTVISALNRPDILQVKLLAGLHQKNDGSIGTHIFQYSINNTFIDRSVLKGFKYSSGYFNEDCKSINELLASKDLTRAIVNLPLWHWNYPREGSLTDIKHKLSKEDIDKVNNHQLAFDDVAKSVM